MLGVSAVQREANDVGIRLRKLDIHGHYQRFWIRGISKSRGKLMASYELFDDVTRVYPGLRNNEII